MNIILANGVSIPVEAAGFIPNFVCICEDKEDYLAIWESLTPESMETLDIYDDGVRLARFKNAKLISTQATYQQEDRICGSFTFKAEKEKHIDPDYETALNIITNGE